MNLKCLIVQSYRICLIGALPPPVYGVSQVNAEMQKLLTQAQVNLSIIDLAPDSLERNWQVRLARFRKIIAGLYSLMGILRQSQKLDQKLSIYIGLSGGFGQLYEALFIALARLFQVQIFLHHHSYAYLNRKFLPTQLLTRLAGIDSIHIVLCKNMERELVHLYKSVSHTFILSNIVFIRSNISSPVDLKPKVALKIIGFLSNIAPEKGIMEFLDVVEQLEKNGVEYKALIAGPFQDREIEAQVIARLSQLSHTEYVGAKYGDDKTTFFQAIDLLLFPTKYANEAEPLTIYEAMSFGVPTIAFGRGCIDCAIDSSTGLVIDRSEDFATKAVNQIEFWQDSPQLFHQTSVNVLEKFTDLCQSNQNKLAELLQKLSSETSSSILS